MKKVWFFLLGFLFPFLLFSQEEAYKITIRLDGYQDSVAFLGNYFGDKLAITDTATVNDGLMIFSGDEALKEGVYFLVSFQKAKLFEFLIGDDQIFDIEKELSSPPDQIQFDGSDENILFYSYLKYNKESYDRLQKLRVKLQAFPKGHDSIAIVRAEMERINAESIDYKLNIVEEHPNSITALLFNIMREPEVPDFFLEDGRHDSISAYLYYRNHYWEYVDFGDDRFLRTPVFHRKLERYMHDVLPGHPDSIIHEIDVMIAATREISEMQNYLLWYFTNTYETSKVMGYDKIFVHMVDAYFTEQSYEWLHPTVQENMVDRANQMRNVLIGAYAPALVMADTANRFIALHQVEADYTIVLFWSSTCGECQKEVETINDLQNNTDIDLKVFAVNTDTTFSLWKKYINEHHLEWIHVNGNISLSGDYHDLYDIYSTPVIFVLDDKKSIIAKRLAADKIPAFIKRHKKSKTN